MGLQAMIQNAASAAFNALGDLAINAQYRSYSGEYTDPQTYQIVRPYFDSPIKGIISKYSNKEIVEAYGRIEQKDRKFSTLASYISGELSISHSIVIDPTEYQIKDFQKDPAGVWLVIQMRE